VKGVILIKRKLFFKGYVEVTIKGIQAEQMIHELSVQRIPFYNLKRVNRHELIVMMKYRDALLLRTIRKKYGLKITYQKRGGVPHFYSQRKRWAPLILSTFVAICLLFVLSNMIWKVEITGGSKETRYEVELLLSELGLQKGNFIQQSGNLSIVELEIMNKIKNVSYVGIERQGSSYYINIQENKEHQQNPDKNPSNLIASKAGIIQNIYVTRGRPMVRVNDFVKEGDVLVTGFLADEGDVYTYSEGTVIAEVWYNIKATIDLNKERLKLVDQPAEKYTFSIAKWEFFGGQPSSNSRLLFEEERPLYFLKWELPFTIHKKYYYEEETVTESFDDEALIIQTISEQLKRRLGQSIEIDYYKILHEEKDNDKVNIELFVKLIEDISEEKMLTEEDMKKEEDENDNEN